MDTCQIYGLLSALCFRYLNQGGFQQRFKDLPVHGIVVYHQHPGIRRGKTVSFDLMALRELHAFVEISDGRVIQHLLFQIKEKLAAFAVFALHLQATAHQSQQMRGNGKPQSRSLNTAGLVQVHPLICIKEGVHILFFHSHAGVFHLHM